MLDFLIIYIFFALAWFITAVVVSTKDCKSLNAYHSHRVYRVNYKGCFLKAFFFPFTIAKILAELIKNVMNKGA